MFPVAARAVVLALPGLSYVGLAESIDIIAYSKVVVRLERLRPSWFKTCLGRGCSLVPWGDRAFSLGALQRPFWVKIGGLNPRFVPIPRKELKS